MDLLVAVTAQADEVVVLGHDLTGRPREVDLEHGHVATQVGDMEDEVVGQVLLVPPQHPAHPQGCQPELVSRGADRLDPGDTEVPYDAGSAEGGEEGARSAVDVDTDVEPGVLLELVESLRQLENRFVGAGVSDPEGGHHHDGVLVHLGQHLLHVHGVVARRHGDLPHLDVPVLGELVPYHLYRPAHHVRASLSACPRPVASPATATWPPCLPACTPPTNRWPSTRRRQRPVERSKDRPASGRIGVRSRPFGDTRPCPCTLLIVILYPSLNVPYFCNK